MKRINKVLAIILASLLALTIAIPAFAEETKGSITISSAVNGETYDIYKIFDFESYDSTKNAYIYKVVDGWEDFFGSSGAGKTYITLDANGYISTTSFADDAAKATFAQAALAYADTKNIDATSTQTAANGQASFTELALGYYLVDSSVGVLCGLTNVAPDATIVEKNKQPTVEKKVSATSDGTYTDYIDAKYGDKIYYKATITAQAGAENYKFYDYVEGGLTIDTSTIAVTLNGNPVSDANYEKPSDAGEAAFIIDFKDAFCATLKADDKIVISYSATVKEAKGTNYAKLTYGQNGVAESGKTEAYTWAVAFYKFYTNENQKTGLAGVKFTLSTDAEGKNLVKLKQTVNNKNKTDTYRLAVIDDDAREIQTEILTTTNGEAGKFIIKGLPSGTYYLTETNAPAGFNKLGQALKVIIEAPTSATQTKAVVKVGNAELPGATVEGIEYDLVEIENKAGALLPTTGGKGTAAIIIVGCVLFAAAAIVLVTKKRMYNEG